MALKDIKTKIKATERMNKVTRAMEAVSAVKMRKTQTTALAGRSYARAALSILARLSGTEHVVKHPLSQHREYKRVALVVMTSDKGLAGALNSSVLKKAVESVSEFKPEQVSVYAYGKKADEYFSRRGYDVVARYENKSDTIEIETMEELSNELTRAFLAAEFDKVTVVYSNFKSTFEQIATERRLLPLSLGALNDIVMGIIPEKGKFSETKQVAAPASYSVEPSDDDILSILIPRLVAVALYHMLLESKASEHSARMVAMKNASDKSKEVVRDLTRKYNKVRQAAITREVSEIISGSLVT